MATATTTTTDPARTLLDLTGRSILVTGASRGIGAEIARRLAGAGARVALAGRDAAVLDAVARDLEGEPVVLTAELSDPAAALDLLHRAEESLEGLDGLVNNAGIFAMTPSDVLEAADIDAIHATNVRAPLLLGARAAGLMAARGGGSIVFVGSAIAQIGVSATVAYSASKGALRSGARVLAAEFGSRGVRVNTVEPGVIVTDMTAGVTSDPGLRMHIEGHMSLGRLGTPRDVAEATAFLVSDAAAYITGQEVVVDGGFSTTRAFFPAE